MKRIISTLLILASFVATTFVYAEDAPVETVKIYVSAVGGNDDADGTIDKPLRTLQAAKTMARGIDKTTSKVEIILRGGDYRLSSSLDFSAADSGTKENPVVYKAYEGEKVYVKASVPLDIGKAKRVTDPSILDRLYDDIETRIIELDLTERGIDKTMLWKPENINGMYAMTGSTSSAPAMYNAIYFDNDEQALASWPNDREFDYWDKTISTTKISISADNIKRWGKAKNTWMAIFPSYDFSMTNVSIKEINPEDKTIAVLDNIATPIYGHFSKRWRIYNLMEEIDIPGEYYIDYDSAKLYFFPPKNITGKSLEISLLGTPMMLFTDADNITFRDIEFCQTRSDAALMKNVDNIDFYRCIFKDIGFTAIYALGTERAITSGTHWQHQNKHGCYNVDIISCDFVNIGCEGIALYDAGDIDTLTLGNNLIEDCFFTRPAQKAFWDTIWLGGCGTTVRNCVVSNNPHQAVRIMGTEHKVEYSEFHDCIREDDDAGVIYQGRNALLRGNDIEYNYIHDLVSVQKMVYNATQGIYFDDSQLGNTATHNILYNMVKGYAPNQAMDTIFRYNTIIDISKPIASAAYQETENKTVDRVVEYNSLEAAKADIADLELYYEKYPNLKKILEDAVNPMLFTEMCDNLMVDSGESTIAEQYRRYAKLDNNVSVEGKDIFVDPEKQDFRLKADSPQAIANPELLNENNFDIEKIGLKRRDLVFDKETAPFDLLYPVRNQTAVDSREVRFTWEHAYSATRYKLIVAEDAEFKDVVLDELVYNCTKNITTLEKNKTYYWKVMAINNSRQFANEWENVGGIGVFSTAIYENPDPTPLVKVIDEVGANVDNIAESELAGQHKIGTKKKISDYLNLMKNIIKNAPMALNSDEKINFYANVIKDLYSSKENLNPGFLDVKMYMNSEDWVGEAKVVDGVSVAVENPEGKNMYIGTNAPKSTGGNVIYCFDLIIENLPDKSYLCVGNNINPQQPAFMGANIGYMLCIKNDLVELQKEDGSKNAVVDTKTGITLCDGKRHSYKFGRLNLGFAQAVYAEIDGEVVFMYPDIEGTEVNSDGGLLLQSFKLGNTITMLPSENVPTDKESFEKVKEELTKATAEALRKQYDKEYVNARILSVESDRIMTGTGVYKIDKIPTPVGNSEVLVSVGTVNKVFNTVGVVSDANFTVTVDGKTATVPVKNIDGKDMVSLEIICKTLGKVYAYDYTYSRNIIVADGGGENLQNIGPRMNKTSGVLKKAMEYEEFEF